MSRVIPHHSTPPSCADLETIAATEFAEIPQELRRYAADVIIRVEDFPDEDVEREMDLESPFDLLGLYRGTAQDILVFGGAPMDVDMIVQSLESPCYLLQIYKSYMLWGQ